MKLYETYRPKDWADVVAQDKAIATLQRLERAGGLAGNAFYVTGSSGTGKTTLARIIASKVASRCNITEIDAGECSVDLARSFATDPRIALLCAMPGRVLIVNEAHCLKAPVIAAFLNSIERMAECDTLIFTTTVDGHELFSEKQVDARMLTGRCIKIQLSRQGLAKPFAQYAMRIAQELGLDGQPEQRYIRLLQDCNNSLRDALTRIQAGEMLA